MNILGTLFVIATLRLVELGNERVEKCKKYFEMLVMMTVYQVQNRGQVQIMGLLCEVLKFQR